MSETPPPKGTPPVTPPVEPPKEPIIKPPEGTPPVTPPVEPPKEDESKIDVKEYAKLMREHNKLRKEVEDLNKDKTDMQRATLLSQITTIDPKLAELYKDSDPSTLETVLKTSQMIGGGFPTREKPSETTDMNQTSYNWKEKKWNTNLEG